MLLDMAGNSDPVNTGMAAHPPLSARARFSSPYWAVLAVWAMISVIMLASHWSAIAATHWHDPDDALRMVEVREWLAGQGWTDLHQYRINPPQGVAMHWSRLVDLPLAAVIVLITPLAGSAVAEQVAAVVVPSLTLLAALLLVARISDRLFGRETVVYSCLAMALSVPFLSQVQPMRVDHHGWQIVLALGALAGVLARDRMWGGVAIGLSLAAWLHISLEGLPMAGAFLTLLGLRWLADDREIRRLLPASVALALGAALLWLATRLPLGLTTYCDALSPVHLALFAMAATGVAISSRIARSARARLACLGATAVTAASAYYLHAPQCAGGAFAGMDADAYTYWYQNILEGMPLWRHNLPTFPMVLTLPLVALVALAVLIRRRPAGKIACLSLGFMVFGSLALSIMVVRSAGVASAMAAPVIGWLVLNAFQRARAVRGTAARIFATVGALSLLALPLLLSLAFSAAIPREKSERNLAAASEERACTSSDVFARLNGLAQGTVMAPLDLGPALLYRTDLGIVASSHHRNSRGIGDVIRAFTGTDAQARRLFADHGAEYLVYCPGLSEGRLYARINPRGLMARLEKGQVPPWLRQIDDAGLGPLRVYKVWPR